MKSFFQIVIFSIATLLVSCHYVTKSSSLEGSWKYERVETKGLKLLTITENDFLNLNSDGSFSYKLYQAGREGKGTWKYTTPNLLELTYKNPDAIRVFEIKVLTDRRLEFEESEVIFKLNKK